LRFRPAGDLALAVTVGDEISADVNTRVRALEYVVQEKRVPGVVEMVPSYSGLLVYYDPGVIGYDELCATLTDLVRQADAGVLPPPRRVEIPCCYEDPELGFDLDGAAARLDMTADALVRRHTSTEYLVFFIGFTPGLPYMAARRDGLTIPRLDTPRTTTPPGSVSIGGSQCCIYSVPSPGGFWVLGRTPLRLYDPEAPEPILLRPGDLVRFRPIDRAEFDRVAAAVADRSFRPVIA
jgi:KipI family sensor histidine kinase inhibitor